MSDNPLADYAALPPADRRAIERHLPHKLRMALRAALTPSTPRPAPEQTNLTAYSPWMRARLVQCLGGDAEKVTAATRQILREALTASRDAQ